MTDRVKSQDEIDDDCRQLDFLHQKDLDRQFYWLVRAITAQTHVLLPDTPEVRLDVLSRVVADALHESRQEDAEADTVDRFAALVRDRLAGPTYTSGEQHPVERDLIANLRRHAAANKDTI